MTNTTDFLDERAKRDPKLAERLRQAEAAAKGAPRELKTVWADEIELDVDKPGLIDGLLASTAMTVIYGESGAGKSFAAIDIACHVTAGLPWYGLEVEQGIVVYVAAESPKSIERRIWAWKKRHGVERLPVLVVQSTVDFLNGDADALVALLERVRRERGPIALVVVDTLARAMTGNENSPEDMGRFVSSCDRLREAGECHVIVVHHCGKDAAKGARGHSSLRAATDVEGEVAKADDGARILTIKKNRDGEEGAAYAFRLEPVELGENAKGRMVTTCVTVACDPTERATGKKERPPGPNEKIVLEALAAALCDHGVEPPLERDIPRRVKVVTVEQWQAAALRYLPQAEVKRRNEAFARAQAGLVADGHVRHVNGYVWIPEGRTGRMGPHAAPCDRATGSREGSHGSRVSIDTRPCDQGTIPGATDADAETRKPAGPRRVVGGVARPAPEPPPEMPGQWMNITAAARRLRVTTKAIRNRIERDSIRWKPNPEREGRLVFVAEREAASDGGAPLRQAPAAAISDGTGAAT